jgi:nicotinamidase-related amidase
MLAPDQSILVVVDMQEKLFSAMPEGIREQALKATENLVFLAKELGIPTLVTEQYPRGLGHSLLGIVEEGKALEKMTFAATEDPGFCSALGQFSRRQVLLCGMETHICVALTGLGLIEKGYSVALVADACLSRRKADWQRGLGMVQGAGVLSSETVLFGMIRQAGTPLFKEVSRRIR